MDRKYGGFLINSQQPQFTNLVGAGMNQGYGGNHGQTPFPTQSHEERQAELAALGAQNNEELPYSPRLKSRKDGQLHYWNHVLAMQPALFVNCDENGNEEATAWYGRHPKGWGGNNEPDLKRLHNMRNSAQPQQHHVKMTVDGMRETTPPAEEYVALGLSSDYLPDFSVGTSRKGNAFGGIEVYETMTQANEAMMKAELG